MNYKASIIISLFLSPLLYATSNWGSSEQNKNGNDQTINFYGTLLTHQGKTDTVDHILIENKHDNIIMYDAPVKHPQQKLNSRTKQPEIKLQENPLTDFVKSKIDLSSMSSLRVPNPTVIWVYQKEKKYQRQEFLLVQVTAKESTIAKDYLLEHKTRIACNSIAKNESQKKEVPLAAVDTLTVEGYSFALTTNKKNETKETAECPKIKKTETETVTEIMVQ